MNKTLITTLLAPLLVCLLAMTAPAASDDMQGSMMDMMKKEMMAEKMSGMSAMDDHTMAEDECPLGYEECPLGYDKCPMGKRDCMMHREHHGPAMGHKMSPMGHGMMMPMQPGMMQHRMDHVFFLDRVDALELSADQVDTLKAIRNDCRRDNIRQAAEAQITKLELKEMLDEPGWRLDQVEPLVRQAQKYEADILLRHLKAIKDARQVLTTEQLKKADAKMSDDLEELFR